MIVVDATFALLVPFGAVLLHVMINGHLFVVIITHPSTCRLAASVLPFGWFDTSQVIVEVQNLQSKVHVEESMYWFVKTRVIC